IPNYLLIRDLGMLNTFQAYWVPVMISAFNLIVLRTYMRSIPEEVIESAKIDGAGHFRVWWQIVMPLCKPALAVIGLFVAVGSWNAWLDTLLYNSGEQWLSTLQYELQKAGTARPSCTAACRARGGVAVSSGERWRSTLQSG